MRPVRIRSDKSISTNRLGCDSPKQQTLIFSILNSYILSLCVEDECGRGSQRGEPQHAGDEQQRNMAHLPAADRRVAHRPAQHSFLHCAARLDPHQRHPQPGDVPVSTHSEGHSLWDTRPRQSPPTHTLGTDGLRCPVHIVAQIPHYLTNCSVHSCQFLHKIRCHTFPNQYELPPQRPPPKVASVSRRTDIWDQQILTELTWTLDFKPPTLDF